MTSAAARGTELERLLGDPEHGATAENKNGASPPKAGTLLASPSQRGGNGGGDDDADFGFVPLKERGWSFQDSRRMIATSSAKATGTSPGPSHQQAEAAKAASKGAGFYLSCVVYAVVNVIISAPALYGYAAVIFNHPVFADHMNALSKLVIFSSLMHQLGFFLFSSLDFAIGTVQDAGLIFLSGMANTIARVMLDQGHSEEEIVSTSLVLLSLGTAALGLVLVIMGHFRLADAVSYLPMPVVGGYLAFIGFFCIQAGIALCISKSIVNLSDWKYLWDPHTFLLAVPGLLAGLVLTLVSRKATNSGVLPLVMVAIPALFYFILWVFGATLDDARDEGWVGPVAPSVPVGDLFHLVDFRLVRWDLIPKILPTWIGMVFVVSFASCLDVAAISIDMGEALDTNRELATVGLCNCEFGGRTYMHTSLSALLHFGVDDGLHLTLETHSFIHYISHEWIDIWIYWILHFFANHFYLSDGSPLAIYWILDHGRLLLYCRQPRQCFANQSPLFFGKYLDLHWL